MTKISKVFSKHSDKIFWAVLIALIIATYIRIILSGIILQYDDQLIYGPVNTINVIFHYFDYIQKGIILDIQPVRDLSYYFDHLLNQNFPWYGPHITNLILWIGILFILYLFLIKITKDKFLAYLFTTFYAVSPVNTSTIAWISGRKHILSTLFVLTASYLSSKYIEEDNYTLKSILLIAFLYLLSGLSQPINCLFPIWVLTYIYLVEIKQKRNSISSTLKNKKYQNLIVLLGIISLFIIIINIAYYNTYYLNGTRGLNKYVSNIDNPFGITFLALGRYFFLCLFPFNALPSTHYAGSIENLIGLILLPLVLYFSFKIIPKNKKCVYYLAVLYFFFPLIPVTFKMTNIFCSDTYMLNAGIGILILMALISTHSKLYKIIPFIFIPYTIFLIIFNFNYTNVFLSDFNIWDYSYRHEATPTNTANLALYYTLAGRFNDASTLFERIEEWNPDLLFLGKLKSENYFKNYHLKIDEKIEKINAIKYDSPTKFFLLSELYAQKQDKENVLKNMQLIFKNKKMFSIEMLPIKERLIAYCVSTCEYFKLDNCQENILKYKSDPLFSNWNQEVFDSSLKIFNNDHNFNFVF